MDAEMDAEKDTEKDAANEHETCVIQRTSSEVGTDPFLSSMSSPPATSVELSPKVMQVRPLSPSCAVRSACLSAVNGFDVSPGIKSSGTRLFLTLVRKSLATG